MEGRWFRTIKWLVIGPISFSDKIKRDAARRPFLSIYKGGCYLIINGIDAALLSTTILTIYMPGAVSSRSNVVL